MKWDSFLEILPLMMIISVICWIELSTHINNNITASQNYSIPRPPDDCVRILRQHLQHGTSKDFITMKLSIVSSDDFGRIQFLFHFEKYAGTFRCK